MLSAKRSFDEDDETFSISVHNNPALVFSLDPDLDLYTLSIHDDKFVSQMHTKLAFGGKRAKSVKTPQVQVSDNSTTTVPTNVVTESPTIEVEEIVREADMACGGSLDTPWIRYASSWVYTSTSYCACSKAGCRGEKIALCCGSPV
jgi:hypothetical protein